MRAMVWSGRKSQASSMQSEYIQTTQPSASTATSPWNHCFACSCAV